MEAHTSPLQLGGILDHGVTSTQFHARIPVGGRLNISDEHLKRAVGVADRDLIGIENLTFNTAANTTAHPVGLVVAHANGAKLATAHRTISLEAGHDTVESVHAMIHPDKAKMPFVPSTLKIEHQFGTRSNMVRTATARAARWSGAEVDNLAHDVQEISTEDGLKKRHLVDSVVTPTSSATTLLFDRNKTNPNFMNAAYDEKSRKMVGDKFIVTDADMQAATKGLKTNLTPQTHDGLSIEAIPLHGNPAVGEVTVAFNLSRKPLTTECYTNETAALPQDCFTVADGLKAMGESATDAEVLTNANDISTKVFGVEMHD